MSLAYHTARVHGLHEEADEIWLATGLPEEQKPVVEDGLLLLPPIPISKVGIAVAAGAPARGRGSR